MKKKQKMMMGREQQGCQRREKGMERAVMLSKKRAKEAGLSGWRGWSTTWLLEMSRDNDGVAIRERRVRR